ncbi:hypothetical protein BC939DRAFT_480289 [Gamsiella multidivaricata]|uniref:uncharacterized protein n=1 Tax=Gamsiella multidivaricata TaxID=101098 RepID=UPI0022208916|nr:uncharacterized protein BC939DRAFT_480289 [Gamsiella multidivaricata]KAI7818507.1 hypothetical protein BC939DRAFT_480289 [Gamsiella multidivaricata]
MAQSSGTRHGQEERVRWPQRPADCEARSEDIMVKGCPAVLILRRCLSKIGPNSAPQLGSERERARRSIKDPSPSAFLGCGLGVTGCVVLVIQHRLPHCILECDLLITRP